MIIKSSKEAKLGAVLVWLCATALLFINLTDFIDFWKAGIIWWFVFALFIYTLIFLAHVAYFRTIEFSESGCVIKFLCFKK